MAKKEEIKKVKNLKSEIKEKEVREEEKQSLFVRFRIFLHGVKSETKKVHWTSKSNLIKYSIATIIFIIICSIFFYLLSLLFAFVLNAVGGN